MATTRPKHVGAWTTAYHTREEMDAAYRAAMHDADAATVDGYPNRESSAEWLSAMAYAKCATGGGLAMHDARPVGQRQVDAVRNLLIATAWMARSMVQDTQFGNYIPLHTIGLVHHHNLLALAYRHVDFRCPDWEVEVRNRKGWLAACRAEITAVHSQFKNQNWAWCSLNVAEWIIGKE